MSEITVACVLKSGGRYTPIWAQRLKAMVARNLTLPHRFICLSDADVPGIETIPLRHGWHRWWSKIELFGPALQDCERALYLDLDTLPVGSLDEVALYPEPIAFAPPHHELLGIAKPKDTSRVRYRYQSSCIAFTPPATACRAIYVRFTPDVTARLAGDQDWIAEVSADFAVMPLTWFRKLRQCADGPPEGVKVIIGDGKFKNDTAQWPWVKELWAGHGNLQRPEGSVAPEGHRGHS